MQEQPFVSQESAEDPTGQVAFDLAMDMRRLLRARGKTPGDESPLCDYCGSWVATHIIADRFLACDKPRCQNALEQKAEEKQ